MCKTLIKNNKKWKISVGSFFWVGLPRQSQCGQKSAFWTASFSSIEHCRPYCLPREYVVYIPPTSNNNRSEALKELSHCISEQQTSHPDVILAGDSNHAGPKAVFPKIHQHIDLPTRGNNTMNLVYTTQRGAYKAFPLPHFVLQTT